jgi:prepilin peptidase CpaA
MLDNRFADALIAHWPVWLVTVTLVVAAIIDGRKLKVPNWLTFPMILSGLIYGFEVGGMAGLRASFIGTLVGLGLLLPAYAIGGMGSGDVKLLAGVGAWIGAADTFYAFCVSAVIGGIIAIAMVLLRREWRRHKEQFVTILGEMITIGSPSELSAIAAKRKSSMLLLPYGIPIAIGTIIYFLWEGLLL